MLLQIESLAELGKLPGASGKVSVSSVCGVFSVKHTLLGDRGRHQ